MKIYFWSYDVNIIYFSVKKYFFESDPLWITMILFITHIDHTISITLWANPFWSTPALYTWIRVLSNSNSSPLASNIIYSTLIHPYPPLSNLVRCYSLWSNQGFVEEGHKTKKVTFKTYFINSFKPAWCKK